MRMDQRLDSCFLDKLRKRNNNNKTLRPLHSSACRGAFFSSCKMVGEGRENNDLSTYSTGSKTRRCIKRIQSCFLKVSCSVKLFSLFWAQTRDFWVLPLGKTDSNSGRRQETWLFLAFLKNLFFPLFLIFLFRATPVPCSNLQKSSLEIVGKTAFVQLEIAVKLDAVRNICTCSLYPVCLFPSLKQKWFFFSPFNSFVENVH